MTRSVMQGEKLSSAKFLWVERNLTLWYFVLLSKALYVSGYFWKQKRQKNTRPQSVFESFSPVHMKPLKRRK